MRVCVVGAGRMGLPVAVQFARAGATVLAADVDPARVAAINAGDPGYQDEPMLADWLREAVASTALSATVDVTGAVRASEAVIVLVRLAAAPNGSPDYTAIDAATDAVAKGLRPNTVVCYETTLPVGDTAGRFRSALEAGSNLIAGRDFHLCFSPERVSSGRIFADLAAYPKIMGGLTPTCVEAGAALYSAHLDADVMVLSSLEAAEFTKVAETTYRDVNIALANEFSRYATAIGVNLTEVIAAANSQPYSRIHRPGIGVGGHCIPVYPRFFIDRARDSRLVTLARTLNDEMPAYAVGLLDGLLGGLRGRHVLVLGLSFRANLKEASGTTAHDVVRELEKRGADVRVHDPLFEAAGVEAHGMHWGVPEDGWAEGLILHTAHAEYRELVPGNTPGVTAVVDGRHFLNGDVWRASGVSYTAVGA